MQKIFEFQRNLMTQIRPVEIELGYNPPTPPLDINLRYHQDWFRQMAWYMTEELVEADLASEEERPEELADCLHFAVELCILAGIPAERVMAMLENDTFEMIPVLNGTSDVLESLGRAMNLLKMKPWKKNPQPTDVEQFQSHLVIMLVRLCDIIEGEGLSMDGIYFAKHAVNEQRMQNGY